jgi:hypothetical protein
VIPVYPWPCVAVSVPCAGNPSAFSVVHLSGSVGEQVFSNLPLLCMCVYVCVYTNVCVYANVWNLLCVAEDGGVTTRKSDDKEPHTCAESAEELESILPPLPPINAFPLAPPPALPQRNTPELPHLLPQRSAQHAAREETPPTVVAAAAPAPSPVPSPPLPSAQPLPPVTHTAPPPVSVFPGVAPPVPQWSAPDLGAAPTPQSRLAFNDRPTGASPCAMDSPALAHTPARLPPSVAPLPPSSTPLLCTALTAPPPIPQRSTPPTARRAISPRTPSPTQQQTEEVVEKEEVEEEKQPPPVTVAPARKKLILKLVL